MPDPGASSGRKRAPARTRRAVKGGCFLTVTIKDIAKTVEVSYATVSRVLNGRPGVKEETRARVLQAAERMGYRPNSIARTLVTKRSQCIGLIIPDITNPFFSELAQGVEKAASREDYSVFLCNTDWNEKKELTYLNLLDSRQVDGVILASARDEGTNVEKFIDRDLPLVVINNLFKEFDCHQVMTDNVRGGYLVADHLIHLGHRQIGYVGGLEHVKATLDRLEGMKMAMEGSGLEVNERLVSYGAFTWESGYVRTGQLLARESGGPPTSIFAGNDIIALGAMQAAEERGLGVPEQLAIVGFDDISFSAYPKVQLTTVSQQKQYLGECAVNIIIDHFAAGASPLEKKRIVLQPTLVVRGTCGAKLLMQRYDF